MSTFHFTLIVNGPDLQDDAHIDTLFEAGCDDASIGNSDGVQYVDFDREASNVDQAVLSAVEDLENIEGVEVVRIADAGLVSLADIAAHVGRTRESVRLLVSGARGPGKFPKPVTDPRTRYRLWRWSEVADWFKGYSGERTLSGDELTATFNAALEFRHHLRMRTPSDSISLRDLLDISHPAEPSGNEQPGIEQRWLGNDSRSVGESVWSKQDGALTAEDGGARHGSPHGAIPLNLHGKKMDTVFHLLGNNENSMTMGLGWCLSQVPSFLDCLG